MKTESKTFKAELSSLSSILHWGREKLKEHKISSAAKLKLELALEEAVVNILTHGKQKAGTTLTLSYHFRAKEYFEWELVDEGIPFNPLLHRRENQDDLLLEERKEGGLGVHLMKEMMDFVDYRREEGINRLILRKSLSP